tara:strand:+ start:2123 stop:2524 length:402 start_codon:yes stop_codon:yes gene_type:complete
MKFFFFILFFLFTYSSFAKNDLTGKSFLCSKLLWGFEFTSFEKLNLIRTDINNNTSVSELFYKVDNDLSYINLFFKENLNDFAFSIHSESLRVDIWTMTSGGITTREIIPKGYCEYIEIENLAEYIENLKKLS